jgi:medium-chain acyl-[acyl-carrier-protein] hydrolase
MRRSAAIRVVDWTRRGLRPAAPGSGARLVCFPYAGGSAAVFRLWRDRLPAGVTLTCVELPGDSAALPASGPWPWLRHALADRLTNLLDAPFWLFGHSLGALLAFELARELQRRGAPGPRELLVSGFRAPGQPAPRRRLLHRLPDDALVEELRRMRGTPREILEEPELLALLLPVLRLDFRVLETHRFEPDRPLECPITAMGGISDPVVEIDALEGWRTHTRALFRLELYPGGHFFLSGHSGEAVIASLLERLQDPPYAQAGVG